MDNQAVILGITAFNLAFSFGFLYIWYRARKLRTQLEGRDGYRLMSIFCTVILVTGLALVVGAVRQILFLTAPDVTEIFRYVLALASTMAIIGVFVWAFVEVKRLINATRDEDDKVE